MGTSAMRSIQMAHNLASITFISFILLQIVNSEKVIQHSGSVLNLGSIGEITFESTSKTYNVSESSSSSSILSSFNQVFSFPMISDKLYFDLKVKELTQEYEVTYGDKVLINGTLTKKSSGKLEITGFIPLLQNNGKLE